MTQEDLRTLVKYCPNDSCGDPAPGLSRASQRAKRRLTFSGFFCGVYAKYECPDCDYTRLFRLSFWGSDYVAKDLSSAHREIGRTIIAGIVVLVALWTFDSVRDYTRGRKHAAAQRELAALLYIAQESTKELIDIRVERAEIVDETRIRILLAVKMRDAAESRALFAHVSGYFLDQNGTRYDPRTMLADGISEVAAHDAVVQIVKGQIYRYYLVAPVQADPTSDTPASKRLTKLTVCLDGAQPHTIKVVKRPHKSL